jgi:hypothetical protein
MDGSASSSLLPTPNTQNARESGKPRDHRADMTAALLSTPQARDFKGLPADNFNQACLVRDVLNLLPTPTAHDEKASGPSQLNRNSQMLSEIHALLPTPTTTQRGTDANLDTREGARANLHNEIMALLPTPRASDGPDASSHARSWSTTDRNLHTLVKNGELTSPPSDAGNPPSVA